MYLAGMSFNTGKNLGGGSAFGFWMSLVSVAVLTKQLESHKGTSCNPSSPKSSAPHSLLDVDALLVVLLAEHDGAVHSEVLGKERARTQPHL